MALAEGKLEEDTTMGLLIAVIIEEEEVSETELGMTELEELTKDVELTLEKLRVPLVLLMVKAWENELWFREGV